MTMLSFADDRTIVGSQSEQRAQTIAMRLSGILHRTFVVQRNELRNRFLVYSQRTIDFEERKLIRQIAQGIAGLERLREAGNLSDDSKPAKTPKVAPAGPQTPVTAPPTPTTRYRMLQLTSIKGHKEKHPVIRSNWTLDLKSLLMFTAIDADWYIQSQVGSDTPHRRYRWNPIQNGWLPLKSVTASK